ncbi:DUF4253 domain-containing protein [Nonomuraea sp. NPDC050663]|uniref:DUF4253 domain-containing protein n=1 Tax=Nonomuraea sp. NPDC050663 TaxID=3364370 RepID=UPI00379340A0
MDDMRLPPELAVLFLDGGADRTLATPLPEGMSTRGLQLWVSASLTTGQQWSAFRAEHPRSGLWPLLLLDDGWEPGQDAPWSLGEVGLHDAGAFMAAMWAEWVAEDDDPDYDLEDLEPFGRECPGLAPRGDSAADPGRVADWYAGELDDRRSYLGLVAARRGAEALCAMGWNGAINYHETPALVSMLLSWEERFGARVVAAGPDTLHLSVSAPPETLDHALHVAAEHFVVCMDNIQQRTTPTLKDYAADLVGSNSWAFWWD